MNIAIIVAGGSGTRMGFDTPKQFIAVAGKPVLVYTLESFQHHKDVDWIEVVCLDGWQDVVRSYAETYDIGKLKLVVSGGDSVQESIRNGVFALHGIAQAEDIIIVHDGIRPMLETEVLSDVIQVCQVYGNAVSSLPYNEQIFLTEDGKTSQSYIPREKLRRVMTPQAYRFALLYEKYREAFEKKIGICGSSYVNTMMTELGVELHFATGSERNMKLTTKDDMDFFRAYLSLKEKEKS